MSTSPLRQRMIDDMTARHFGEKAQKDYIRCVKNLGAFLGRSPETADLEDLRRFRLHLIDSSLSVSSVNTAMQALRFFFSVTLDKPGLLKALFRVQGPQKLPTVLTQEEVARLLESASCAKYKAALSVAYGAGLRASEVVSLKVSDIDSARMVLRVEQGKGRRAQVASCGSAPLIRPPRHAFPDAARYPARMVAHRQTEGVAVSGTEPSQPTDHAPVEPHLSCSRPRGRDRQACFAAHVEAQLCDASAGAGY
jgi:integrase/recombinase XerD